MNYSFKAEPLVGIRPPHLNEIQHALTSPNARDERQKREGISVLLDGRSFEA
jgi:hypothetical protein